MKRLFALLLFCSPASAQYFSSPPVVLPSGIVPDATSMMTDLNRIVSDGNTTFNALAASLAGLSGSGVPSGAVAAFNLAACPAGWVLADGTGGTPDMRGVFPKIITAASLGAFQADQFIDHSHSILGSYTTSLTFTVGINHSNFGSGATFILNGSEFGSTVDAVNSGAATGAESRPANVALRYCMKS